MKIGRNDPCHCGSGKKYKKCCLNEDISLNRQEVIDHSSHKELKNINRGINIRAYTIAKMCEPKNKVVQSLFENDPDLENKLNDKFYPSKIRKMSTTQIIDGLIDRQINFDKDIFISTCSELEFAWDVADRLWPKQSHSIAQGVADYTGISACILWERFYMEGTLTKASNEMLDDWIEKGYQYSQKDHIQACEIWLKAWETFKANFDLNKLSINEVDAIFGGTQSLFNWCQNFEIELHNASIDDKKFAAIAIKYFTEFLNYFSDEEGLIISNMKRTLSEISSEVH